MGNAGTRCDDGSLMIDTIEECQEAVDEVGHGGTVYDSCEFNSLFPCGCTLQFGLNTFNNPCAFGDGNPHAYTSPICRVPTPEPPAANGGGGTYY